MTRDSRGAGATALSVAASTPDRVGTEAGRPFRTGIAVLAAAAAVVLGWSSTSLVRALAEPSPITPYVAPLYWLGYGDGFVRRALPGALARLLAGGADPSLGEATAVGVGASVLAVLAVLLLAALLARRACSRASAVGVAAAVVASPLTVSLLARDLGRPDAFGVVVLVALAAVPWRRLPAVAVAVAVAVLTTAAVAAEELLVAFVLPVGLLALRSAGPALQRPLPAALALAPSVGLALLSAAVPVSPALLDQTLAAALAAGVPPSPPILPGYLDHDAVSRLGYGFVENARTYYSVTTPVGVVVATLLCVGFYLLVLLVVRRLLGGPLGPRAWRAAVGLPALAALALAAAGIDYRRWWALALVTALGLLLQLTAGGPRRPAVVRTGLVVALVVLAVTGATLQTLPLWPVRSLAELVTRLRA